MLAAAQSAARRLGEEAHDDVRALFEEICMNRDRTRCAVVDAITKGCSGIEVDSHGEAVFAGNFLGAGALDVDGVDVTAQQGFDTPRRVAGRGGGADLRCCRRCNLDEGDVGKTQLAQSKRGGEPVQGHGAGKLLA
ncbi:hypothetical protein GCM10020255_037500 [Rhodococcus baikonurensis]